jgi:uncharacterized protein YfdQ (DUF2303 family)
MSEDLKPLFDEARALHECRVEILQSPDGEGIPVLLSRSGAASLKSVLDSYRTVPERTTGTAALVTLDALIAHAKRFAAPHAAAFCDPAKPSLTVVYDYDSADAPRWRKHRAYYPFPLSREWRAWAAADGQWMGQGEFAAFLEDRAADVVGPGDDVKDAVDELARIDIRAATPSQILAASKGLDVTVSSNVTNRVNLANGGMRIVFEEDVKSPVEVPGGFVIAIPMFDGEAEAVPVPVRLRLRVEKAAIKWGIALLHADRALRDAVEEAVKRFTSETSVPVLYGAPE